MDVKINDEIWLAEKWIDVYGGHSLSQIVITHEGMAKEAEQEGWTVTKYQKED